MGNTLTFTLPSCPPSVNSLYEIRYHELNPADRVKLKPECRTWKSDAKLRIPMFRIAPDSILRVDHCYSYPWFGDNGAWLKRDTQNMTKLLFDAIAERVEIEDSRFKCGMMDSRNSASECVVVVLTEVTRVEWEAGEIVKWHKGER